jgi:transcriptional regulator with XRE-family HTH domain
LLKLSQAELARDAEISVSTVRRYEAGTLPLSAYAARQIITALKKHKIVFVGGARKS